MILILPSKTFFANTGEKIFNLGDVHHKNQERPRRAAPHLGRLKHDARIYKTFCLSDNSTFFQYCVVSLLLCYYIDMIPLQDLRSYVDSTYWVVALTYVLLLLLLVGVVQ